MSKPERRGVFRFCAAADHLDASMAALNRGLAAAELPEELSLFVSRAEHDAAIEALRERAEKAEKPKYFSTRDRSAAMPYVDDATEAAFIAADKESEQDIERFCKEQGISPASVAFAFGFRAGFRTAHPTWQAILAKRKAFAESPEGRARRAWIDMVIAANKLIAKGRAPPMDEGEEDDEDDENENVENENEKNESGPPPVKVPPNSRDKDKPEAVHVATAAEILRAGAVRRGEVTALPVDPVAHEIIRQGALRRGEKDPTL